MMDLRTAPDRDIFFWLNAISLGCSRGASHAEWTGASRQRLHPLIATIRQLMRLLSPSGSAAQPAIRTVPPQLRYMRPQHRRYDYAKHSISGPSDPLALWDIGGGGETPTSRTNATAAAKITAIATGWIPVCPHRRTAGVASCSDVSGEIRRVHRKGSSAQATTREGGCVWHEGKGNYA